MIYDDNSDKNTVINTRMMIVPIMLRKFSDSHNHDYTILQYLVMIIIIMISI